MSARWKVKVIVVGDGGVGKTSFLHDDERIIEGRYCSAQTLGITIETSTVIIGENENKESCVISLWDQKSRRRFVFMYPSFYRGATGAILCFDISSRQSFEDLTLWLDLVRKVNNNIPIVLVGAKSDLPHEVNIDEIESFVREHNLLGYFLTTVHQNDQRHKILKLLADEIIMRRRTIINYSINDKERYSSEYATLSSLLEHLRLSMPQDQQAKTEEFLSLSEDEKQQYFKFLEFFSNCPVCKRSNHRLYLKKFYFNNDYYSVKLRERLIELMEEYKSYDNTYSNPILLGIPCCECCNKYNLLKIKV